MGSIKGEYECASTTWYKCEHTTTNQKPKSLEKCSMWWCKEGRNMGKIKA